MIIKAVIFDLDGTLLNLPIDYPTVRKKISEITGNNEVKPMLEAVSQIEDPKILKQVFDTWTKFELDIIDNITIHPEGIQHYKQHTKLPKALVTMQSKETLHKICQKFNLQFDTAYTREDTLDRIEQLKLATTKLGVKPVDTLFIGNIDNDENAAKQIGCQFIRIKSTQ